MGHDNFKPVSNLRRSFKLVEKQLLKSEKETIFFHKAYRKNQ